MGSYDQHRERARDRQAAIAREGRDIGEPPDCAKPRRRAKCEHDLRKYLETYHKPAFPLKWSPKQLELIDAIERAVLESQLRAVAMPRGSGKTTILERAVLWAALYRHHEFAYVLAATDPKSRDNLDSIKMEVMCNDLLFDDFPELLHPLHCLEWIANRAQGQHVDGVPTLVKWGKDHIVFPTIDERPGPIIKAGGLLTAVRGAKVTRPNGVVCRPSIALVDDPQTRASAKSALQSHDRAQTVSADVLGMAGPGKTLALLMACTVIQKGDMADRILDRKQHPHMRGIRTKMLESFPDRIDLWEQYNEILTDELRADGDGSQATKFYRANRKAMDSGAKVTWRERYDRATEISAVQHAMNLWLRDQEAFFAEYQNEPIDIDADDSGDVLEADEIARRCNHLARGDVPSDANLLTCYVDCQDALLYYAVIAWADDFTGAVIEYGTWPEQAARYFTLRSAKQTLPRKWPKLSKEGRLRKALDALLNGTDAAPGLMARSWKRTGDNAELQVKIGIVDGNYLGDDVVYPAIEASPHRSRLIPAHGRGITSRQKPFSEYKKRQGERAGLHWRIPKKTGRKALRHLLIDTNFWKSFVHSRLATDPHERGSLQLFKGSSKLHAMIADHLTAEKKHRIEGRGRVVDEWTPKPGADNHLFDCIVGAAVGASIEGCELRLTPNADADKKPDRQRRRAARSIF